MVGAMVAGAAACESPTLPLPPPAQPGVSMDGVPTGQVRLKSEFGAEPNAFIVTYDSSEPNAEQVGGAHADSSGSWETIIYAHSGDWIQITQSLYIGAETSAPVSVQVPP
jgi:hypothetical protein